MAIQKSDQDFYTELAAYTLAHPNPNFIHQEVVDAYAAQHADENSKPIYLIFALAGLYLYLEKDYTGKQVQRAHMLMAKKRKDWPRFLLPENRGEITIKDVLVIPEGSKREEMIKKWCQSAWDAYQVVHKQVGDLVESELWQEK